ncbi:hypothetical protein M0R72_07235 [Candidatus Pacearchaeota archaeon]|jgi:4-hydroxybenzoate polyprenyltransferase|nr:hypothetical protein [Candidatus Pacearchaeota archaeon]
MSLIYIFRLLSISSIWIALSASLGPAIICKIYGLPYDPIASALVFLVTWAVYAIDKVSGSREDLLNDPDRAMLAKYPIKRLAAFAYVAAIVLVTVWRPIAIYAVLAPGIAGALYTTRICGIRPKDIPLAKNLIVATATAFCYGWLTGSGYMLIFLLMMAGTIFSDLRDICGDSMNGVRTLPVILGSSRTLMVLAAIDVPIAFLSPVIAAMIGIFILYFSKQRPNLQYDLLIDGWMIWIYALLHLV